jgi:hypothetical protein
MRTFWIFFIVLVIVITISIIIWYKVSSKKMKLAYADLDEYAACVKVNDAFGVLPGDVVCEGLKNKIKDRYGLNDQQIEQYLLKTK